MKDLFEQIKGRFLSDLGKKSFFVFLFRIMGMILSYGAIIFISNQYGSDGYGRFSLSFTLLQLLTILFSLGIPLLMVKLGADKNFFLNGKPKNNYIKKAIIILAGSCIVGSLVFFSLKKWLAISVFHDIELVPYFNAINVFLIFVVFHSFLTEYYRSQQKFITYGLFTYTLPYLFFLFFLYGFYKMNYKEQAAIYAYLLSITILVSYLVLFKPIRRINNPNNYKYKQLLNFSFPLMFSMAFIFLSNWTDVFMLGSMVSKAEVGVYNAAYKLAAIILIIINAVNTVLAPKIASLYAKNEIKKLKTEVQKATRVIFYSSTPIWVILVFFRKQLLGLFGSDYLIGEKTLVIILSGMLLNALSGSVGQVMNMTSHQKEMRNFTIISVICNIGMNYFLIKMFGIDGAAIASFMSGLLLNILCIIYIKKRLGFYTFLNY